MWCFCFAFGAAAYRRILAPLARFVAITYTYLARYMYVSRPKEVVVFYATTRSGGILIRLPLDCDIAVTYL